MALTIGSLLEGRDRPLTATPKELLSEAIEQMLKHDYTQLPVVDSEGRLEGVVTSDSILKTLDALGLSPSKLKVADATIKGRSFDPDGDIAEVLDGLRDQYAAIVVDSEGKVAGIVTGYDASEYFRRRAEDMMLVEDIESSIRDHVLAAYTGADGQLDEAKLSAAMAQVADPHRSFKPRLGEFLITYGRIKDANTASAPDRAVLEQAFAAVFGGSKIPTFEELTLSHYVDLLLHASVWPAYQGVFGIDGQALRRLFDAVRQTRNALAHFRGEISATARAKLRFCTGWLERHPPRDHARTPAEVAVVSPPSPGLPAPEVAPVDEEIEPGEGRYARLAMLLQRADASQDDIAMTFGQIDAIIGDKLPHSARVHRSWWANDSVSHPQSKRWLEVGWRVATVSLANETVVFSRMIEREAAYIRFFSNLIAAIEGTGHMSVNTYSPSGVNWHTFARLPDEGPGVGQLVCSFARGGRIRVELYIDTQDKDVNKAIFDRLSAERRPIEHAVGSALSWERLDSRRACRIAAYRDGAITAPKEEWDEIVGWAATHLVALRDAISKPFSEAVSLARSVPEWQA